MASRTRSIYEEYYIMGYNALLATYLHADFLLGVFFNPEDGGDIFLRNFC
jgi:hypothetical protein